MGQQSSAQTTEFLTRTLADTHVTLARKIESFDASNAMTGVLVDGQADTIEQANAKQAVTGAGSAANEFHLELVKVEHIKSQANQIEENDAKNLMLQAEQDTHEFAVELTKQHPVTMVSSSTFSSTARDAEANVDDAAAAYSRPQQGMR